MIDRDSTILVTGAGGLVGSAVVRMLKTEGFSRTVTPSRAELDLRHSEAVQSFFEEVRPRYCILAAARVGGILANSTYPADFIRENLQIQMSTLEAARACGVEKLTFLGSSCIYPRLARQPIPESELLNGHLEPTNAPYAVAKIAGITMCQAYWSQYGSRFISVMPTNVYGPGDNFDLENAHVLPALLRRFHEAKKSAASHVVVWGTGEPRREFMYVEDLAGAIVHLMDHYESPEVINAGTGVDVSIRDLAEVIRSVVGYQGDIRFDPSKPDGTPRKLLDVTRLSDLGWEASVGLTRGIEATYEWFLANEDRLRR